MYTETVTDKTSKLCLKIGWTNKHWQTQGDTYNITGYITKAAQEYVVNLQ